MKTKRNHSDFIKSQSGSMVMQVLIVAIMLTIVAGAVMGFISRQNVVHTNRRIADEIDNFQTIIQMALSNEDACHKNLVAGSFGSTPADLGVSGREITLRLGQAQYAKGSQFGSITIKSIRFGYSEKLNGMGVDYLNELIVDVYDSPDITKAGTKSTKLPIYFGDLYPSDQILDSCFATSYVDSPPVNNPQLHTNQKMTAEDVLCTQFQLRDSRVGQPIVFMQFPPPPMPVYMYKPSFQGCKVTP